ERHPLDERPRGAHHAVEPPAVVVAPGVVGRECAALVVLRRRPDEALAPRPRERPDGTVEPERRERGRLTGARPESGAPEQPLRLRGPERTTVNGERRHTRMVASGPVGRHPRKG